MAYYGSLYGGSPMDLAIGSVGGPDAWRALNSQQRWGLMNQYSAQGTANAPTGPAGVQTMAPTGTSSSPTATGGTSTAQGTSATNPYQFGSPINVGSNTFTFGGYGQNGTTNWTRDDGSQFNNLTRDQFNQYAPDYTSMYYGGGTGGSGGSVGAPLSGPAPLTDAASRGLGMGLTPFDPQWLDKLGQNLYGQASQHFLENVNPALDSAAIMASGYGGDRTALAKGVAADRLRQGVTNAIAPLYHQGYESSLNRGLQAGQTGLQGLLGLGNLELGQFQADTARTLGQQGVDINRRQTDINSILAEAQAAGNPIYTNPWASAIGGGLGIAQLLKLLQG